MFFKKKDQISGHTVEQTAIFQTIINSIKPALIIVDNNGNFVTKSQGLSTLLGITKLPKEESIVLAVQVQLEHLLVMQHIGVNFEFIRNTDSDKTFKELLQFKDGRTIEATSSPYKIADKIVGRCWIFTDISRQVNLVDKLKHLAFTDPLTQTFNRRWCEKKLKQLLIRQSKEKVSFLYLDLDHFKIINDSCGHLSGDLVLEEISKILKKVTNKQNAYLARMGGDEFGVILTLINNGEAINIAQSIKQAVDAYQYNWKGKVFKLGVSIGLVFAEKGDDVKSVLISADEACYVSKKTGRNQLVIYNPSGPEFQKSKQELQWYDVIQKALTNNRFELWCQPITDMEDSQVHYEILLRMLGDNNEVISPGLFLDAADRFGLTHTIDKYVVTTFCKFYDENRAQIKDTIFSINISGQSLGREDFLPFILKKLKQHSVTYQNICFEITESEIIKNIDMALLFINVVRSLGCKISMDDFGKGLTSFSYLKNIPYDYIKIDGQFIREVNKNKINEIIIKSIVNIADVMGKKTIAEHIESKELLSQISAMGVDYFQGNYFSKPHKITKLLE